MKFHYCVAALVLFASACTFTPNSGGADAAFHPPLVAKYWQIEHYTAPDGSDVCSLSSGYNGLTLLLARKDGKEVVWAKSNRLMQPGSTFTVNVDNTTLRTSETRFAPQTARALVEHLAKGDKAYLEWSEFSGPFGNADRVRVQNIVQLSGFAAQLKECRNSL